MFYLLTYMNNLLLTTFDSFYYKELYCGHNHVKEEEEKDGGSGRKSSASASVGSSHSQSKRQSCRTIPVPQPSSYKWWCRFEEREISQVHKFRSSRSRSNFASNFAKVL